MPGRREGNSIARRMYLRLGTIVRPREVGSASDRRYCYFPHPCPRRRLELVEWKNYPPATRAMPQAEEASQRKLFQTASWLLERDRLTELRWCHAAAV